MPESDTENPFPFVAGQIADYNFSGVAAKAIKEGTICVNYLIIDLQSWYENSAIIKTNKSTYEPKSLVIPISVKVAQLPDVKKLVDITDFDNSKHVFPKIESSRLTGLGGEIEYCQDDDGLDPDTGVGYTGNSQVPDGDLSSFYYSVSGSAADVIKKTSTPNINHTHKADILKSANIASATSFDAIQEAVTKTGMLPVLRYTEHFAVIEEAMWVSHSEKVAPVFNAEIDFTSSGEVIPLSVVLDPDLDPDIVTVLHSDSAHVYKEDLSKTYVLRYEIPDNLFTTDMSAAVERASRLRYLQTLDPPIDPAGPIPDKVLKDMPEFSTRWFLHIAQSVYFSPAFIPQMFDLKVPQRGSG